MIPITPHWSAPSNVHAYMIKRELLKDRLTLPTEPLWLTQTHSNQVVTAGKQVTKPKADAAITHQPNTVLTIITADCLPILLCHNKGQSIAAIHAGWRGLANHIITNTLKALQGDPSELLAWIGPGICQAHYVVGDDVYQQFPKHPHCFKANENKWLMSLTEIAREQLREQGVKHIYTSSLCTYEDSTLFFSYRRDGAKTGRMASLIWFTA